MKKGGGKATRVTLSKALEKRSKSITEKSTPVQKFKAVNPKVVKIPKSPNVVHVVDIW